MGHTEFGEKIRSLNFNTGTSRKSRVVEGKAHPDSGLAFKSVTDDNGVTVTEHGTTKSGVSERQDVTVRPTIVNLQSGVN